MSGCFAGVLLVFFFFCLNAISEINPLSDRLSGHAFTAGIDSVFQSVRARNRADTSLGWTKGDVALPCEDLIGRLKKEGKKLPGLVIAGESHDTPYNMSRKAVLKDLAKRGNIRLGLEDFDVTSKFKGEETVFRGIEEPHIKSMMLLALAYKDILLSGKDPEVEKRYGYLDFIIGAFAKPQVQRAFSKLPIPSDSPLVKTLKDIPEESELTLPKAVEIHAKLSKEKAGLPGFLKALIFELIKSIPEEAKKDYPLPKDLNLETAYALDEIEKLVEEPENQKRIHRFNQWFEYFGTSARDHIMSRNIAKLYCDSIGTDPAKQVVAVVGQLHVGGIQRDLDATTRRHGILVDAQSGVLLEEWYATIRGSADAKTGVYSNQPIAIERHGGHVLGWSKQRDGGRIALLSKSWDFPGTRLGEKLLIFDATGSLRKSLGVEEGKPISAETWASLEKELSMDIESQLGPPKKKGPAPEEARPSPPSGP